MPLNFHYRNSYIKKITKRINEEIVEQEIKKVKLETKITGDSDKFKDSEAEKFNITFNI